MSNFFLTTLRLFVLFGRNTVGCINKPYMTCRKLSDGKTDSRQTVFIFLLVIGYFAFASVIRVGLRNPFLLTVKFNSLLASAVAGFLLTMLLLVFAGRLLGQKVTVKAIFTLWSFSLLPTIVWFLATSVLFILLPPPRTLTVFGKAYSLLYLAFSIALLFWKLILYYLTLRFSLKIDMTRIFLVSLVIFPSLIGYSLLMYKFGVFRIPFI